MHGLHCNSLQGCVCQSLAGRRHSVVPVSVPVPADVKRIAQRRCPWPLGRPGGGGTHGGSGSSSPVDNGFHRGYKMIHAGRIVLAIAMVAASATALPNHLKAAVDTDPIPNVPSVSANFGGYSAKAGLGGSETGGVLFAAADSPHGSASAGLGGGVAGGAPAGSLGASAGTGSGPTVTTGTAGHKPGQHGPGLFDGIFNIPISVLQAVNTYLNNREPIAKPIHRRRGHHPVVEKTPEKAPGPVAEAGGPVPEVVTGVEAESGAQAGAQVGPSHPQGPVVVQKRVNYDDIFNIPISVLKSVNQLLNGKK